jgi:hypothetical protein
VTICIDIFLCPRIGTVHDTSAATELDEDEEPNPLLSHSVIDELFERLTTLPNQLESVIELSSLLKTQHTAVLSTISALESKVTTLEDLVRLSQAQAQPPKPEPTAPAASDPLTEMLNE